MVITSGNQMLNILVVDDEEAVTNFCRMVLTKAGHSVTAVHSGQDALAALDSGEVDLVLADVRMPAMSGFDLLQAVTSRANRPEVILFTGHGSVPAAVEAMRCGAYDYLLKPVSSDDLVRVVQQVEKGRAWIAGDPLPHSPLVTEQETSGLIGRSPLMLKLFEAIVRVAGKRHPVLITGETGTGKELVARAIHRYGSNPDGPFVPVDCGALQPGLLESELFGHVRGAYPGAIAGRPGLLATAAAGTLFLDDVAELKPDMQARFFRLLQEGEFRPVGSETVRAAQARVVAATSRDLEDAVAQRQFRPELYYRLGVYRIEVPPLRVRKSDIPALIGYFVKKHAEGRVATFSPDAVDTLANHDWPGNVRELEHCVLQMMADSDGGILTKRHIPRSVTVAGPTQEPEALLDRVERGMIVSAMQMHEGRVAEVAKKLGISTATLYRKLKQYGLSSKTYKSHSGSSPIS